MKRFISIIVCITSLVCFSMPYSADSVYRYGDWTLSALSGSDDFSFGIRSYEADDAVVTVPNDYGGYPIIAISGYAFATNKSIREVILSDQITLIGDGAFAQCENLTRIVIPDSVTQIGDDAFQGCNQVVVYASAESYAIAYAKEHGIEYVCPSVETYVLGDADGDGKVNILDATTIQRYLADLPVSRPDIVKRNGAITGEEICIMDATLIQRYIAQIKISYEVGKVITVYNE